MKNRFLNVVKNGIRQNGIYIIVWSVFLLYFTLIQGLYTQSDRGSNAEMMLLITSLAAMLVAWLSSGTFGYLNSREETDFIHSKPVRRQTLFYGNYLAGLITVFAPYITGVLIYTFFNYSENFYDGAGLFSWFTAVLTVFAVIFIIYNISVFGRMLCGNSVIAFLVSVFTSVLPFLISAFFNTIISRYAYYIVTGSQSMFYLTPYYYLGNIGSYSRLDFSGIIGLIIIIAISIFLVFAAMWMYNKRKSENAGKPVVFRPALLIIKTFVVMASMYVGGMLFYSFSYLSSFWELVGYILFGVVAFLAINVAEVYDIKNVFKNLKHLALIIVIFAAAYAGTYGYVKFMDNYIPDAGSIESITFNDVSYAKPINDRELIDKIHEMIEKSLDGHYDYDIYEDHYIDTTEEYPHYYQTHYSIKIKTKYGFSLYRSYPVDSNDELYLEITESDEYYRTSDEIGALDIDLISQFVIQDGEKYISLDNRSEIKGLLEPVWNDFKKSLSNGKIPFYDDSDNFDKSIYYIISINTRNSYRSLGGHLFNAGSEKELYKYFLDYLNENYQELEQSYMS